MKIACWNVNSIKARGEHVKRYLTEESPDVLMLQELKGPEFPGEDFKALGYESAAVPQKTYNGVAILSKTPITVIHDALPGDKNDEQARYLEVDIEGTRMIAIYLPNGNPVFESLSSLRKQESSSPETPDPRFRGDDKKEGNDDTFSEKYAYKLAWMQRLYQRLKALRDEDHAFLIGGDFNVIPEKKDCYDPTVWIEDALFRIETRKAYRSLVNLGLTDAFRVFDTREAQYSFWDYQAGAWQKNNGIRIDHFLLSPTLTDRLEGCRINKTPRGWDKPSDHTPIEVEIA